jgi:hypothetical protein
MESILEIQIETLLVKKIPDVPMTTEARSESRN